MYRSMYKTSVCTPVSITKEDITDGKATCRFLQVILALAVSLQKTRKCSDSLVLVQHQGTVVKFYFLSVIQLFMV